jgi:hypothetical protein
MNIESWQNNPSLKLDINGNFFDFVKNREHSPVQIFKGEGEFLKLGPKELLQTEINFHKRLLDYEFPVSEITGSGEKENKFYYTETSLGEKLFGDVFWEDCLRDKVIGEKDFSDFLAISESFAKAQLNSAEAITGKDEKGFYLGAHFDIIQDELPDFKTEILSAFEKLKKRLSSLPYVLTHGDLNPYNFLEKGVIDFGNAFQAPAGYDLVSNVSHIYFFPPSEDYEMSRRYGFTQDQLSKYYGSLDEIYQSHGLDKLSQYIDDFIFSRAVWASTQMHHYPKVQEYRYNKLKEITAQYLAGDKIDITKS